MNHYDALYKEVDANNTVTLSHSQYNATKLVNQSKNTTTYVHKVYWLDEEGVFVDVTDDSTYCRIPTNGTGDSAVPSIEFSFSFLKDGVYAVYTFNNKGIGYNAPGSWCLVNCNVAEAIDETKLQELQTLVTTLGNSYYQTDDRWNGGDTYCASGFWATYMKTAYDAACGILQNPLTNQSIVDAINALNGVDKSKLIPTSQVNATILHETVQTEYSHTLNESDYTVLSWKAYSDAKADAEAYLKSLFDENGAATSVNVASEPSPADAKAKTLTAAYNGLYLQSTYELTQQEVPELRKELGYLFQMIDKDSLNSSDYASGWEAFETAYNAAIAQYNENSTYTGASSERNDLENFRTAFSDLYNAWLLLEESGSIKVTLTVNDSFGAEFQGCELTDPATAVFQGSKTLVSGKHSLKDLCDLFDWSGVNVGPKIPSSAGFTGNYASTYLVYINGIAVRDPALDRLPAPLDQSPGSTHVNYLGFAQPSHDNIQLHDGDEVVILRVYEPMKPYYGVLESTPITSVINDLKLLRFTTDPASLSPTEGDSIGLNLVSRDAYWSTYTLYERGASGKEIVYYGPMNDDGTYPVTPTRTGCYTDANGNATITLTKAGSYVLTAVDTSGMDCSNYLYPGLAGGAHLSITVTAATSAELEEAREAYLLKLDELLAASNVYDYTEENWQSLNSIITTGKTAIETADSMDAILSAYQKAVEEHGNIAVIDNAGIMARFASYLKYLPSVTQIKSGLFTKADQERMGWLLGLYNTLTGYQKEMISPEQSAQYNALTGEYGTDGSALPDFTPYAAELIIDDLQLIHPSDPSQFRVVSFDQNGNQIDYSPRNGDQGFMGSLESGETATYSITVGFDARHKADAIRLEAHISKQQYDRFDGIDVEGAEIDSITVEDVPMIVSNVDKGYYRYVYYILNPYKTFTIHIKTAQDQLQVAKNKALTDLENALNGYIKSEYSTEGWKELTDIYSAGVAAINAATDTDAVTTAKEKAILQMSRVEKKADSGELGSVTVIVENTTYGEADFTDTILETTVSLMSESSMMTCVLTALATAEPAYSWTGTGGSDYGITYLSSIYIDANGNGEYDEGEKSLAEFDGGRQSGWMGTLNDWFVNEGFASFTVASGKLKDGDVIRVQYTVAGYGTDLGATRANNDTSLKELNVDGGSFGPKFESSVLEYVLSPEGGSVSLQPTAANKNFQVRIFLNQQNKNADAEYYRRGESIPVKSGDVVWIGVGEKAWGTMNDGSIVATWYKLNVVSKDDASSVIKLINAIGSVTYSNYETKQNAVDLARAAYNALTSAAKSSVTNLDTLTKAEAAIAGYQKVGALMASIDALPRNVTEDDQADVEAAKDLYDELAQDAPDLLNLLSGTSTNKLQKAINTLKLIDALKNVSEIDFVSTKANTVAAVIGVLEDELGGMKIDGQTVTVVVTLEEADFTAADETGDGNYTATVSFKLGESGAQAATQKKTISGTIKRSSNAGIKSIPVKDVPPAEVSGTAYKFTLPYGTDLATVKAEHFAIGCEYGANVTTVPESEDGGKTWTFTVTAQDGITTKPYTVTLSVSNVKVTVLDSWVYYVSDDAEPVKLDASAVSGLLQVVNTDALLLDEGTEEVFLWVEARQKSGDVFTITPVYAPVGKDGKANPADYLIGTYTLTLPVPGTEYAKVLFDGKYLDAAGSDSGITFAAKAGDYTLIPDAHIAIVTFHEFDGTNNRQIVFYRGDAGEALPEASKSGAAFKGWYAKADCTGDKYTTVSATLPTDLYPLWSYGVKTEEVGDIEDRVEVSAIVQGDVATITVESKKPCAVIVEKPNGSFERLEAFDNGDGSCNFVQKDYDADMVFYVATLGDYDENGVLEPVDLTAANLTIIGDVDLEPLSAFIMGAKDGKLRTVDLAKLFLHLARNDVEW